MNALNEKILELKTKMGKPLQSNDNDNNKNDGPDLTSHEDTIKNKGRLIVDATACPQDIVYPTDLNLLSEARENTELIIDTLYDKTLHKKKPKTYRKIARKLYLNTAQKKIKHKKVVQKAVKKQLNFVKRNIKTINKLLDQYQIIPLLPKLYKTFLVVQTLYEQQKYMYDNRVNTITDRLVSISQPHVRPIVRGKSQAKVEFGAKIHISLIDGIVFLDDISWDAFNEGSRLMRYVEQYFNRFGFYPREILADKIYCTRENRKQLKDKNIKLVAKPLGRPSSTAVKEYIRPGERNPIEGKFWQAKTAYGLDRIKARLKQTSECWIAAIILVLNLVKLTESALLCKIRKYFETVFQQSKQNIYLLLFETIKPANYFLPVLKGEILYLKC